MPRHILGEVAITDRISGYVGVIKTVKIIPMPGIAITSAKRAPQAISMNGGGLLPERAFRPHDAWIGDCVNPGDKMDSGIGRMI